MTWSYVLESVISLNCSVTPDHGTDESQKRLTFSSQKGKQLRHEPGDNREGVEIRMNPGKDAQLPNKAELQGKKKVQVQMPRLSGFGREAKVKVESDRESQIALLRRT